MINRPLCCMTTNVFLAGLLMLSVGFNLIFVNRIHKLDNIINNHSPVSNNELKKMMKEIDRLSIQEYTNNSNNIQYDVKTKEPVQSFHIK